MTFLIIFSEKPDFLKKRRFLWGLLACGKARHSQSV
jgi:hypothetical protein